jgi:hypothetical protein
VSTVRFSDAVTALIAAFAAAPALTGVTVDDGVRITGEPDDDFIVVGHDGSLEADGSLSHETGAGTWTQSPLEFEDVRQESGAVNCVAISQTGDTGDLAGRRARVQVLVAACEDAATALQPTATGGIIFDGGDDQGAMRYRQVDRGAVAMITFTIGYSTQWS